MEETKLPEVKTPQDEVLNVDDSNKSLIKAIEKATTKEELEPLYQQFNINNTKKNVARIEQLNNLLDKVNKQAIERFEKRPDEISNKEIIDYMNAVQNQIERSQQIVDGVKDINATQINTTINVNMHNDPTANLPKDSRTRVTSIIADILEAGKNASIPNNVIDAEVRENK